MRRLLVAVSSILLVSVGLAPAAHADSTIPITSFGYDPALPYYPVGFGCGVGPTNGNQVYYRIEQDTPPPPVGLGSRSWGYQLTQHGAGDFYGRGADVETASGLDTFQMKVYGAAAGSGRAMIFAVPPGTAENRIWIGTATIGGGGDSWTTVDAANLTYAWSEYTRDTYQVQSTAPSSTLDAFVTLKGASSVGYSALMGFGCGGQDFYFDGFAWGSAGNVTTLDFEALSSELTIARSPATITAGKTSRITGTTTAHFQGGTPVDLEVKAYGSSIWKKVATVTTPYDPWTLSKYVAPLKRASYRWHFLEVESTDESFSSAVVVNVKTAITASIVDRTLRRGQNLVVTGRTRPAKPGATLTLWRVTTSGPVLLARTRVRSDGTYRVVKEVNRNGNWTIHTTVPAASGNLAGRSVNRSAYVG